MRLKVVELFAGVGGFRLGLEDCNEEDEKRYRIVWSNQWEPSTKTQHASRIYEARFGSENHSNENISEVPTEQIPDHDLLVGGFPCQDYSVATTLSRSNGLIGKKGVLWWEIYRILNEKENKPNYLLLENVDRLLLSPSKQKGRDFAIMLKSLGNLGYAVEWRVINAAEYGMPQRRKRVFILAYRKGSPIWKALINSNQIDWLSRDGVFAESFPIQNEGKNERFIIEESVEEISESFNLDVKNSPFKNTGLFLNDTVYTFKSNPLYDGVNVTLGDILLPADEISEEFIIPENDFEKWEYLKGSKKEIRVTTEGYEYRYAEGSMTFPDDLSRPSRTIITGEGGRAPSRFKHVVPSPFGLRRLTPIELERLNMFPDNYTKLDGISYSKRAFLMGNALVVGIIQRIGESLYGFNNK